MNDLNPEVPKVEAAAVVKEDHKAKTISKTRVVCAINERELNKVELAYFKRPLT